MATVKPGYGKGSWERDESVYGRQILRRGQPMAQTGGNGLGQQWAQLKDAIASRLWPIPLAAIIVGVLLGIALPEIDRAVDQALPATITSVLFSGGTDAARAVLSTIAGSLITATALTFSLTVVALQIASSQASPRLLRIFTSDGLVHATLAIFLGTFAYALAVLRTVADADGEPFVPRIAVTIASMLTLASVVMLAVFLGHLARELRVDTMLRKVHKETQQSMFRASNNRRATAAGEPVAPTAVSGAAVVAAPRSGFIIGVDREKIVDVAKEHDVVVQELFTVGTSVIADGPVLRWWPRSQEAPPDRTLAKQIADRLASTITIDYERTPTQDIEFGLRQLVDIALRALSPGVNDPTTAVHALSHVSAVLVEFDRMPQQPYTLADEGGQPRLVQRRVEFEELLELAMTQTRRHGASDPDVAARLFRMLEEVGQRVRQPGRRAAVAKQLERLEASVASADYDETERQYFARIAARVRTTVTAH